MPEQGKSPSSAIMFGRDKALSNAKTDRQQKAQPRTPARNGRQVTAAPLAVMKREAGPGMRAAAGDRACRPTAAAAAAAAAEGAGDGGAADAEGAEQR